MEEKEMDMGTIGYFKNALLPSWWIHTDEGKRVMGRINDLETELATLRHLLEKVLPFIGWFTSQWENESVDIEQVEQAQALLPEIERAVGNGVKP